MEAGIDRCRARDVITFSVVNLIWGQRGIRVFSVMSCRRLAAMFPYFTQGIVVKGFGRGSKQLGIPTGK